MPDAYRATLSFSFDSDALARAVEGALSPEAGRELPKATSAVSREGLDVTVAVEASDAATLRAAVNSYLRWAKVAEEAALLASRGR